MTFKAVHVNLNVTDLDKSIAFYEQALGLEVQRRKQAPDGSFEIAFIGNALADFQIELTWLAAHPEPYELGDNETHIAFVTDDFDAAHQKHEQMGAICFENPKMGIYFIHDPDDYWIEIIPEKR